MQGSSPHKIRQVISDPVRARRLALHMWRHFQEDRCFDEAASLSYTSLLSLVPLLAVIFGVVSAFPVFEDWIGGFRNVIFANLVPDSSSQVEEYLETFTASVQKLTLTGTAVLIVTALLLMVRIERSFNRVWRVPEARGFVNKVTVYWAVLTLGPLALGAATALSAQPLVQWLGGNVMSEGSLRSLGVFGLTWGAFWLMFVLVPNTRVPISYAALGSFLSTALFTLAKVGFVYYVSKASFSVIYGALASVPVFLLWLFIVWLVILLGASLAASLSTFTDRDTDWLWPSKWEFLLVLRLLGHLYNAQGEGRSMSEAELLEREPGVTPDRLQALLAELAAQDVVSRDRQDRVMLKRDLERLTLRQLYQAGDYHLPMADEAPVPSTSPWDRLILKTINAKEMNMDRTLAYLFRHGDPQRAAA
jgi:membrane protein